MFEKLYDWLIRWAKHPKAEVALTGFSIAESSFFPIPVDVLLAPMTLARPNRAWRLAALTTVASVFGGVIGYFIGLYSFDFIQPTLESLGWGAGISKAEELFKNYGVWITFMAGFSPIPYKLFTISAGALTMSFLPFVLASIVGRGLRFFLVAGIVKVVGESYEPLIKKYIEPLGWIVAVTVIAVISYLMFAKH
jgi:membrane protein YqaA with SNARE-associated domain